MKANIPHTSGILLSVVTIFMLTSCQKEQQLPQSDQTDLAIQHSLSSRNSEPATLLITGGGSGTFDADLDGDGDIDGSHFGVGVSISNDGTAKGHFECLMAGNADILGLPLMAVEGEVSKGSANADGSATFSGTATVNLGKSTMFKEVPFSVTLRGGGPREGSLRLTVIGAFDGVPGDTNIGNGNYDLPTETVATGGIKISH
jgi:hypothetical protein